ncbi:MAG: 16S rRNA (cytosine(1402)-N(4))-methyltransferase RsmH [Synergistaceae bacterium]|jgi:16S rRNA (cytosine1402-N4)-methyltransferase|nr:16S rRNA (cytosine(1402)-N(4))-methyltransferase RsmH [Synergistaceae bacterium]
MLGEVLGILREHVGEDSEAVFVDATLGAGGHARAMLEAFPRSRLIGFDQDSSARDAASESIFPYIDRVRMEGRNFREMYLLGDEEGWPGADGILFDLGVSGMQLSTPERGFSYQEDGPLDMRMDPGGEAEPASSLLGRYDARELTVIFREYGEERYAFQIARSIVRFRERGGRLETTGDLTRLIRATLPSPVQRRMGTHPARRVFQALRIAVNSELDMLVEGLEGARRIAGEGGVVVVISYHSLEDRIVKRTFLRWGQEGSGRALTRRPLTPSDAEVERNRSSRSAKLRAFKMAGAE